MSRHAAPPSRRSRRSPDSESTAFPGPVVSVADLVTRHRAVTHEILSGDPYPSNSSVTHSGLSNGAAAKIAIKVPARAVNPPLDAGPLGPVTAADLIARYAPAGGLASGGLASGGLASGGLNSGGLAPGGPTSGCAARHRHASATRRRPRSVFVRPVPIKVVARPALVFAAVVATVAAVDASSTAASRATSAAGSSAVGNRTGSADAPAAAVAPAAPNGSSAITTDRVSRERRADNNVPLVHFRPGQTVPGVWVRPNSGPETSCFCMRWGAMHAGIDLAGPLGSPILAVGDGVVIHAGPQEGFGNTVLIRHANGDVTLYGHMRYYFVQVGQHVTAGQKIALVGSEGNSTGPHLHFEVHLGGSEANKIDPVPWLKARGVSVGAYDPNG